LYKKKKEEKRQGTQLDKEESSEGKKLFKVQQKTERKKIFSSNKSRPNGMVLERSAKYWAGFYFILVVHAVHCKYTSRSAGEEKITLDKKI